MISQETITSLHERIEALQDRLANLMATCMELGPELDELDVDLTILEQELGPSEPLEDAEDDNDEE